MSIIEHDPWRQQYFENIACPEHIIIPTDDRDSYELYPRLRWVYDKTNLCKTQNILHASSGVIPLHYPVFSKPITNLRGMGVDGFILYDKTDYHRHCKLGCFWMEFLTGDHVSTDFALINGKVVWQCHTQGYSIGEGLFDYWHISSAPRQALENYCRCWLQDNLGPYTGLVNIETIGGKIIEVHLRLIDQWPDLYGRGWLEAVIGLYDKGEWSLSTSIEKDAYSIVLFGSHDLIYDTPPDTHIQQLKTHPSVSSIQITFTSQTFGAQAMPPGGFRLAIINCYDLQAGFETRNELRKIFDGMVLARSERKPNLVNEA